MNILRKDDDMVSINSTNESGLLQRRKITLGRVFVFLFVIAALIGSIIIIIQFTKPKMGTNQEENPRPNSNPDEQTSSKQAEKKTEKLNDEDGLKIDHESFAKEQKEQISNESLIEQNGKQYDTETEESSKNSENQVYKGEKIENFKNQSLPNTEKNERASEQQNVPLMQKKQDVENIPKHPINQMKNGEKAMKTSLPQKSQGSQNNGLKSQIATETVEKQQNQVAKEFSSEAAFPKNPQQMPSNSSTNQTRHPYSDNGKGQSSENQLDESQLTNLNDSSQNFPNSEPKSTNSNVFPFRPRFKWLRDIIVATLQSFDIDPETYGGRQKNQENLPQTKDPTNLRSAAQKNKKEQIDSNQNQKEEISEPFKAKQKKPKLEIESEPKPLSPTNSGGQASPQAQP